jgi:VIT1/CCC1 family predicted Fe2+/Mn2+ transporter
MTTPHEAEQHSGAMGGRLNWLRAAVLGANDGIVSTAGLVVGGAGATSDRPTILVAGLAGLVAGALSMAGGEFVSVSSQSDTERAALRREEWELANLPEHELEELAEIYRRKGLSPDTARQVAEELTAAGPLAAHADAELHIDPDQLTSPSHAAVASALAFTVGACLPLLAIVLAPSGALVTVTVVAVLVALALAGLLSARLGGSPARWAVLRLVVGGAAGLALTYAIGKLFGTAIG